MKTTTRVTTMVILMLISGMSIARAQDDKEVPEKRTNSLMYCRSIQNLTTEQKEKIAVLNEEHWKQMDQVRKERFEAEDIYTRNEIGAKMLLLQNDHLKKIEALLTDTQKEQFVKINTPGGERGRAMRCNKYGSRMGRACHGGGYGRGFGPGRG